MAASDYDYDPTGLSEDNLIENEVHALSDRGIMTDHGPFFREGLVVEGYDGDSWSTLEQGTDYVYSPIFLTPSANTGKSVFSYLVFIGDLGDYTQVRLTYQALGQYIDSDLLAAVSELSAGERLVIDNWFELATVAATPALKNHLGLARLNPAEILNTKLSQVLTYMEQLTGFSGTNIEHRMDILELALGITEGEDPEPEPEVPTYQMYFGLSEDGMFLGNLTKKAAIDPVNDRKAVFDYSSYGAWWAANGEPAEVVEAQVQGGDINLSDPDAPTPPSVAQIRVDSVPVAVEAEIKLPVFDPVGSETGVFRLTFAIANIAGLAVNVFYREIFNVEFDASSNTYVVYQFNPAAVIATIPNDGAVRRFGICVDQGGAAIDLVIDGTKYAGIQTVGFNTGLVEGGVLIAFAASATHDVPVVGGADTAEVTVYTLKDELSFGPLYQAGYKAAEEALVPADEGYQFTLNYDSAASGGFPAPGFDFLVPDGSDDQKCSLSIGTMNNEAGVSQWMQGSSEFDFSAGAPGAWVTATTPVISVTDEIILFEVEISIPDLGTAYQAGSPVVEFGVGIATFTSAGLTYTLTRDPADGSYTLSDPMAGVVAEDLNLNNKVVRLGIVIDVANNVAVPILDNNLYSANEYDITSVTVAGMTAIVTVLADLSSDKFLVADEGKEVTFKLISQRKDLSLYNQALIYRSLVGDLADISPRYNTLEEVNVVDAGYGGGSGPSEGVTLLDAYSPRFKFRSEVGIAAALAERISLVPEGQGGLFIMGSIPTSVDRTVLEWDGSLFDPSAYGVYIRSGETSDLSAASGLMDEDGVGTLYDFDHIPAADLNEKVSLEFELLLPSLYEDLGESFPVLDLSLGVQDQVSGQTFGVRFRWVPDQNAWTVDALSNAIDEVYVPDGNPIYVGLTLDFTNDSYTVNFNDVASATSGTGLAFVALAPFVGASNNTNMADITGNTFRVALVADKNKQHLVYDASKNYDEVMKLSDRTELSEIFVDQYFYRFLLEQADLDTIYGPGARKPLVPDNEGHRLTYYLRCTETPEVYAQLPVGIDFPITASMPQVKASEGHIALEWGLVLPELTAIAPSDTQKLTINLGLTDGSKKIGFKIVRSETTSGDWRFLDNFDNVVTNIDGSSKQSLNVGFYINAANGEAGLIINNTDYGVLAETETLDALPAGMVPFVELMEQGDHPDTDANKEIRFVNFRSMTDNLTSAGYPAETIGIEEASNLPLKTGEFRFGATGEFVSATTKYMSASEHSADGLSSGGAIGYGVHDGYYVQTSEGAVIDNYRPSGTYYSVKSKAKKVAIESLIKIPYLEGGNDTVLSASFGFFKTLIDDRANSVTLTFNYDRFNDNIVVKYGTETIDTIPITEDIVLRYGLHVDQETGHVSVYDNSGLLGVFDEHADIHDMLPATLITTGTDVDTYEDAKHVVFTFTTEEDDFVLSYPVGTVGLNKAGIPEPIYAWAAGAPEIADVSGAVPMLIEADGETASFYTLTDGQAHSAIQVPKGSVYPVSNNSTFPDPMTDAIVVNDEALTVTAFEYTFELPTLTQPVAGGSAYRFIAGLANDNDENFYIEVLGPSSTLEDIRVRANGGAGFITIEDVNQNGLNIVSVLIYMVQGVNSVDFGVMFNYGGETGYVNSGLIVSSLSGFGWRPYCLFEQATNYDISDGVKVFKVTLETRLDKFASDISAFISGAPNIATDAATIAVLYGNRQPWDFDVKTDGTIAGQETQPLPVSSSGNVMVFDISTLKATDLTAGVVNLQANPQAPRRSWIDADGGELRGPFDRFYPTNEIIAFEFSVNLSSLSLDAGAPATPDQVVSFILGAFKANALADTDDATVTLEWDGTNSENSVTVRNNVGTSIAVEPIGSVIRIGFELNFTGEGNSRIFINDAFVANFPSVDPYVPYTLGTFIEFAEDVQPANIDGYITIRTFKHADELTATYDVDMVPLANIPTKPSINFEYGQYEEIVENGGLSLRVLTAPSTQAEPNVVKIPIGDVAVTGDSFFLLPKRAKLDVTVDSPIVFNQVTGSYSKTVTAEGKHQHFLTGLMHEWEIRIPELSEVATAEDILTIYLGLQDKNVSNEWAKIIITNSTTNRWALHFVGNIPTLGNVITGALTLRLGMYLNLDLDHVDYGKVTLFIDGDDYGPYGPLSVLEGLTHMGYVDGHSDLTPLVPAELLEIESIFGNMQSAVPTNSINLLRAAQPFIPALSFGAKKEVESGAGAIDYISNEEDYMAIVDNNKLSIAIDEIGNYTTTQHHWESLALADIDSTDWSLSGNFSRVKTKDQYVACEWEIYIPPLETGGSTDDLMSIEVGLASTGNVHASSFFSVRYKNNPGAGTRLTYLLSGATLSSYIASIQPDDFMEDSGGSFRFGMYVDQVEEKIGLILPDGTDTGPVLPMIAIVGDLVPVVRVLKKNAPGPVAVTPGDKATVTLYHRKGDLTFDYSRPVITVEEALEDIPS